MTKVFVLLLFTLLCSSGFPQDPDKMTKEAIALAEKGKLEEAFRIFIQIKKEYQKRGDTEGVAGILNNIGRIYYMMNNLPEARRNFRESYVLYRSLNDKTSQAQLIMNLGSTYVVEDGKELDKALKYYREAYVLYRALNDSMGINQSLVNIGSVYGRKGESRKALNAYLEALPFMENSGAVTEQAIANVNIGTSYYELHQPDSARIYLYKAQALNRNPEYEIYISRTLAKVYAELHEPDSVSRYIDLFAEAKDKLQNEQTTRSIAEISHKYEAQVKEEEIGKLKLGKKRDRLWLTVIVLALVGIVVTLGLLFRNRMIRSDHQRTDLEHRILRAQMNPHFLFNCLSSIQRMYIEGNTQKANDLTSDFGALLRRILDHTSRTRIRLQEELDTLRAYMKIEQIRLGGKFRFAIIVAEDLDVNNILVPPLITQSIVENAIWHGIVPLENNGEIIVQCSVDSDQKFLLLTITDNGVGFAAQDRTDTRTSKGIELVEKRLTSKGSLEIGARPEGGTRVMITLPVEYED